MSLQHPHPSRRDAMRLAAGGAGLLGMGTQALAGIRPEQVLHHAPRARRVVWLFQSGGPSQLELLDHKPLLAERQGEDLPPSVRKGQRLTTMSANQATSIYGCFLTAG